MEGHGHERTTKTAAWPAPDGRQTVVTVRGMCVAVAVFLARRLHGVMTTRKRVPLFLEGQPPPHGNAERRRAP